MRLVTAIAMQEFKLNRRNKWVMSFALFFIVSTLMISYFGMVTSGYSGFQDFTRTSASLINLVCFLLPVFALLLGVFSFISNREYLEMMTTQPVSRSTVILGKYLGLLLTVIGSTLVGFSIPGIIFSLMIGTAGALSYIIVVLSSILLGVVFTGISVLIVLLTKRQQISIGISLGVWIFFEIMYGFLMLGSTVYLSPSTLKSFLIAGLMGNPIDITRVLSLLSIGGAEFFGPGGATLIKMTGSEFISIIWGLGGMIIWSLIPILIGVRIFRRQDF